MFDQTPAAAPNLDLDEHTANDVARLSTLSDEIADRKKQVDEIKAGLRDRFTGGFRYRFEGREVLDLAKPGKQFDGKLAASVVPAPLLAQISIPKPDADLARRILPADLYERCCADKAAAVKTL